MLLLWGPLGLGTDLQSELLLDQLKQARIQRCLIHAHALRLHARGEATRQGIFQFAQEPGDVAEDRARCALAGN